MTRRLAILVAGTPDGALMFAVHGSYGLLPCLHCLDTPPILGELYSVQLDPVARRVVDANPYDGDPLAP